MTGHKASTKYETVQPTPGLTVSYATTIWHGSNCEANVIIHGRITIPDSLKGDFEARLAGLIHEFAL